MSKSERNYEMPRSFLEKLERAEREREQEKEKQKEKEAKGKAEARQKQKQGKSFCLQYGLPFFVSLLVFLFFFFQLYRRVSARPPPLAVSELPEDTKYARLPNDLVFTYVEFGPANGTPVLFLHGNLHTGRILRFVEPIIQELNLRVIALDRPGWGYSDVGPEHDSSFRRHVRDISFFLDVLGLEQVNLLSYASSTPYAAAMVFEMPERFNKVVLVSPVASLHEPGVAEALSERVRNSMEMAASFPQATYLYSGVMRRTVLSNPKDLEMDKPERGFKSPDAELLADPLFNEILKADIRTSVRRSGLGYAYDMNLASKSWGFSLVDISHPQVFVFGGDQDIMSPPYIVKRYGKAVRGCMTKLLKGGSWVLLSHFREIATTLLPGPDRLEISPGAGQRVPALEATGATSSPTVASVEGTARTEL